MILSGIPENKELKIEWFIACQKKFKYLFTRNSTAHLLEYFQLIRLTLFILIGLVRKIICSDHLELDN